MKRYKKDIAIEYHYLPSLKAENCLEEIFGDIFKRIMIKKQAKLRKKNERKTLTITQFSL